MKKEPVKIVKIEGPPYGNMVAKEQPETPPPTLEIKVSDRIKARAVGPGQK